MFVRDTRNASKRRLSTVLTATTSFIGVLAAFPAAYGQGANTTETVVVTGTAIKGVAPVGTNLITVNRDFIESTGVNSTEQLLAQIPQLPITFGVVGQGGDTNSEGTQTGPSLHGIGSQNAQSTLVLMDGHRLPSAGQSTSVVDPSVIPAAALQRVEILPDGASSIYGADAVSGVMNFIIRKDFTGLETNAQVGIANNYNSASFSQLIGHSWTGGNFILSYQYSNASHLMNRDRAYLTPRQDILRGADISTADFAGLAATPPAGSLTTTPDVGHGTTAPFNVAIPYPSDGVNKDNFNCPIATIAANSTAPAFLYPYNGTGISVTQTTPNQGVCSQSQYLFVIPSSVRNSALFNLNQQITPSLVFTATAIYSGSSASKQGYNTNKGGTNHGTITATVFGPTSGRGTPLTFSPTTGATLTTATTGGQINPFYVGNSSTGTSSEIIRYDFNELLANNGIQPVTHDGGLALVGVAGLDWDMGGDWDTTFDIDIGYTEAPENDYGALCTPCANLALNGTLNSNGTASNTAATSAGGNVLGLGLGSIYNVTEPLTTKNALDVWNPVATNRTTPEVLRSLVDSTVVTDAHTTLDDFTLKTSGPLFDLFGAGPIKIAVGGEYEKTLLWRYSTSNGLGGTRNFAQLNVRGVNRLAQSAFMELNIPIVSNSDMPLLHQLSLDISGRYDHFSDFGETKNPKIGLDWIPFDGVRTHASFGTSFVEPAINTVQAPGTPGNVATSTGAVNTGNLILFNSTTGFSKNPNADEGSGIAGTWVSTAASCAAAGSNPVDAAGNTVAATSSAAVGCKLNLTNSIEVSAPLLGPIQPEKGMSYSAGMDIDAGKLIPALDGLNASVTYYNIKFTGYITGGGVTTFHPEVISFAPPGGWSLTDPVIQQVLAGNSGANSLPSTIYIVSRGGVQNAFDLWQQGLDFTFSYRFNTDDWGAFTISESGNQILSAQQGSRSVPRVSTVDGRNSGRQTNIEFTSVTTLGWHMGSYTAQLQASYAHPFSLANSNFPFNLAGPAGTGYMHVGPQYLVNLHTAYNLPDSWLSGMQMFVNIQNLLDTKPPFSNAGSVSNGEVPGNPIGREFLIGFRLSR